MTLSIIYKHVNLLTNSVCLNMNRKAKLKSFTVYDKISGMMLVDVHVGTYVELASWLWPSVYTEHNCEHSWTNWKLLCPLWNFSPKVEIFGTLTEGRTGISSSLKQSHRSNISIEGTHLKEKTLHIIACLGIDNFSASDGWIYRCKRQHCCLHCYCVQTYILNSLSQLQHKATHIFRYVTSFWFPWYYVYFRWFLQKCKIKVSLYLHFRTF